jgi:DNA invertase Pin-like site-specific DNA recombinase
VISENKVRGRPPKLTPKQLDKARRMIAKGISQMQVARSVGVSHMTLYKALKKGTPARAEIEDSGPRKT